MVCCVVGAVSVVICEEWAKHVGFLFPRYLLPLALLGDAYAFGLMWYLLWRLNKSA